MATDTISAPPRAADAPPSGRSGHRKRAERRAGYLFVAPDMLGLSLFLGLPMLCALVFSFFTISGFGQYTFIGTANYERLLTDPLFLRSLKTTAVYVVAFVPLVFVASLGLAMLIKDPFPGVGLVRAALFMPNIVSLIVIGVLWQFMLVDKRGVLDKLLAALGSGEKSWLGDPSLALGVVIAISVWFFMGFYMLIFLAGLQDIPREYYEAARVDGANWGHRFRHVTWPILKPTSFFVLLMSTIGALGGAQVFDLVYALTGGGPSNATTLTIFYIYLQAFQFNDFGYAAAMAVCLLALLAVFTGAAFALTRGGRFEENS